MPSHAGSPAPDLPGSAVGTQRPGHASHPEAGTHWGAASKLPAGLSLAEKVSLLSGKDVWRTKDLPGRGIGSATMSDGPHGLRRQEEGGDHLGATGSKPATCFPTASALGCTWDPGLIAEVGAALGAEAAAQGVDVLLGPGLNIKRHPFCGRNFEYLAEDPLLSGRLAAAMVRGIQSTGVSACLKHFAVNNQEFHRLVVDAVVDERTLREIYLAGFEIAVKQGHPDTVMAAYNRVNGAYCCEHPRLLSGILRDEWGFTGLVMSDWGATNDRTAGVAAGMDLEMPGSGNISDAAVIAAVAEGRLSEEAVDLCSGRVVALARRHRPEPRPVNHDTHHRLARRAAAQSAVLLANSGLLPLQSEVSVAVIGAFAEHPRFQGAGSSLVNPTRLDTLLAAMRQRSGVRTVYAPGYDPVTADVDHGLLRDAAAAAREAQVAVVVVGLPGSYESEGFDRADMALPRQHDLLVDSVCSANPDTIVVLMNGSPVSLPWADRPKGILACHLGGQAGGSAIVGLLFGDEEPSGRLAESYPFGAADVPSDPWFPGDGRQADYREGVFVGYRYYGTAAVAVRFPFGHGLSYTTFEHGGLLLAPVDHGPWASSTVAGSGMAGAAVEFRGADIADDAPLLDVRVRVRNTGDRAGAEVVQLYVHPLPAAAEAADYGHPLRPDQELRGFAKVRLSPGQGREVVIPLGTRAFAHFDAVAGSWAVKPGDYEIRIGSSSANILARAAVRIADAGLSDGDDRLTLSILPEPADEPPPAAAPGRRSLIAESDEAFAALLGRPLPVATSPVPFHRNSTIGDLRRTDSGRALRAGLLRILRAPLTAMADGDEAMLQQLLSAADEAPLRQIALFSNGLVTWRTLDAVIDWLNGHRAASLRGLAPAVNRQLLPAALGRLPRPALRPSRDR